MSVQGSAESSANKCQLQLKTGANASTLSTAAFAQMCGITGLAAERLRSDPSSAWDLLLYWNTDHVKSEKPAEV